MIAATVTSLVSSAGGPYGALFLAPVVALWAAGTAAKIGARAVVAGAMIGAAVTAPMNGIRAPGGLALVDVFLVVAAVAVAAESLTVPRSRRARVVVPAAIWAGLALILIGGTLGTFFAPQPAVSLVKLLRFGVAAALPLYVLWGWRPDPTTLRRYVWCWVGGALASGLLALLSPGDASGRSAGLTTHPNHLAMISSLGAGLALALAVSEDGGRRWLAAGSFGLLVLIVIRAGSRAGLAALVVTSLVVALRTRGLRPRPIRPGRFALLVCASGLLLPALVATKTVQLGPHNALRRLFGDSTATASDRARVGLLHLGLHSIVTHPLTGSGFDNALQAHNIYVQIWAAAGVAGLIGLLVVAVTIVRTGLRAPDSRANSWLVAAFVGGYLGYLVAGAVQNFLWDRYLWLHVAVILWLGSSAAVTSTKADACG